MTSDRNDRWVEVGIGLLLLATVWLLYAPSLALGFLSDDWYFLRRAEVATLPELFRLRVDPADPQSYHYVPIGEVLYWLEVRTFGLDARGWHAVNLCLHAFNGFLSYRLWVSLGVERTLAGAAATAFAVLFFHYETMLFVCGLFYLVATAFLLAALLCFRSFLRRPSVPSYLGYLCFAACSLLSIEAGMVTAPLAGLIELAWVQTGERWPRRLAKVAMHQMPVAVMMMAYVALRALAPRTSMHDVPVTKVLGTFVYSLFGVASMNVPAIYELCFAHKRVAAAVVALALGVLSRRGTTTRFALCAFIVAYAPHFFLSGFETRYFYIPGVFAGLFLATAAADPAVRGRARLLSPWFLVLGSIVAAGPYRAERIREWERAAEVTSATLARLCPALARADGSRVESMIVVDAPDSFGRLWGISFPAYVFRNGLSEALGLCLQKPSAAFELDFVETGAPAAYNVKASRRLAADELAGLAATHVVVRYDASDPRDVDIHFPRDDSRGS